MNLAFLPDLSALAILVVILFLLRQQHRHEQADMWLLGLFLTLVEAVAHTFYAQVGPPAKFLHVIVLDCYLLAGMVFLWASGEQGSMRWRRFNYLALNSLPLLALNTTYGLHLYTRQAYFPAIAMGLLISTATALYLRRSWQRALLQLCGWLVIGYLVHVGKYRDAVYWSLSCIYLLATINFIRRGSIKSTGRLAIITGFVIWSLCFFIHPFIVTYRDYADIASHIWNLQKSLISIGMILVMLEEQVSNNRWLALHDELTGLPNRRSFEDRLAASLERRRTNGCLAVFLLDLNGFKQINDSFGHHAGDEVLRQIACRLKDDVQGVHTLARLGGDEFTFIACDFASNKTLNDIVDAIQRTVERPILIDDGKTTSVTASLGIALYPNDAHEASRLLRIADQRMYAFKQKPTVAREPRELRPAASLIQRDI
jgi:diguanylate cyclase